MADYSALSGRTLGEVKEALTGEGAGVALGLIGAGFIGRSIQNRWVTDAAVTADPNLMNYVKAWLGNNGPKLAVWYYMRNKVTSEIMVDAKKAVAGSVVFDSIMRALNKGINPATAVVGGYEVLGNGGNSQAAAGSSGEIQKVIQENSALRIELNNALQRLAEAGLQNPRQKKFAFAGEQGLQTQRQKKYAFAGETGVADLTARFGML